MPNIKHIIINFASVAILAIATLTGLPACDSAIYDGLDPCPQGARLRFVYDYNMEFANAFPSQVHCLTLLIYDGQGRLVDTRTETTSVLSDENYRMTIDLPEGKYHFVAYGGMACENATFKFVDNPTQGSLLTDLSVRMDARCIDANPGVDLHPLFYGDLDLTVEQESTDYVEGTVYMMKDTNNIRILLQNQDGTPLDSKDFTFTITDNNTLFNYKNDVVPTADGNVYNPWASGDASPGTMEDGGDAVLAYAEFSTSRLTVGSGAKLIIKSVKDGDVLLSIPLVNYLLLLKSDHYASMGSQEFLDRESRWNMIFFLIDGKWLDTHIVINDWIVRLNSVQV
ncbi:MAG: FimB/Mfa2 family fimbrial subunit [Bacteroides sp.]|nr:FimB/Mfa2 family fimbrial subunit [Bacteroides sp.]